MEIKFIGFILLLIVQYGSCLDSKNCTNSSKPITSFPRNRSMKFYLFTNRNFNIEQQIYTGDKPSLENSNFNADLPLRIIVHGWRSNFMSCFNAELKDAYLIKGKYNVIVIDWGNWAENVRYIAVVPYIFKLLGPLLAEFIKFLNIETKIRYNNIYIIGHSLGAHLAGSAGQNIQPNKINTIFGLDPAGPGFQTVSIDKRLDSTDAKYVEQITTNMGEFGYTGVLGHSAFFPNYGRFQPYCLRYERNIVGCSHSTSYYYFIESINTKVGFCAQSCSYYKYIMFSFGCTPLQCPGGNKILMGGEPSIPKNGTYFLKTSTGNFAKCICKQI